MEKLVLNIQSKNQIIDYIGGHFFAPYERAIFDEILQAIDNNDQITLDWFGSFGDSFHAITLNVHAYRQAANCLSMSKLTYAESLMSAGAPHDSVG